MKKLETIAIISDYELSFSLFLLLISNSKKGVRYLGKASVIELRRDQQTRRRIVSIYFRQNYFFNDLSRTGEIC